eukprot:TRINITY_DN65808_c0_g1_i1.p1 TRINITY_DN65808_c0_g1~~TRINITY_DN65808_c0_g1_i1.p1  ORF type:complete len:335 (-),score=63.05 TRINITY_DN65808_c0_g1_i1:53-1057(-)
MPGMQQPASAYESGDVSGSAGEAQLYGALLDNELKHDAEAEKIAKSRRRRRMNCVPLILAFLAPWCTFLFTFCLATFYVHFAAPFSTTLCQSAILLGSLYYSYSAWAAWKQSPEKGFYALYVAVTVAAASALGWALGDVMFYTYTEPAFSAESLVTYSEVDPSTMSLADGQVIPTSGGRFQDAGKVYFNHDTVVDVSRAFSFKLSDLYCVAPIVNTQCRESCGHDFWAVGKNCCSQDGQDFRCADFGNKHAKSGLRLMETTDVPFYRMAVIEAAGKHKIFIQHPLFFHWLQDPVAELHDWVKRAYRRFMAVMLLSFAVSGALLSWLLKVMHVTL